MYIFIEMVALATILLSIDIYIRQRTQKQSGIAYYVTVKFAHGIKTKLVLNEEQYTQFQAVLNEEKGFFDIGDDVNHVYIYREFICSVEVKKK